MPSPELARGMPAGRTMLSETKTPVAVRPLIGANWVTSSAAATRTDTGRTVRSIWPPMVLSPLAAVEIDM